MQISFVLNGRRVEAEVQPGCRLLDLLREQFDLTGAKEGCGQGECGACTVIVDDQAVNSCLVLAAQVDGAEVLTIEGLSRDGRPDPLQQAFLDEGALQCGYCTPGVIMSAKALLMRNPSPDLEQVKEAISGNLCRCTGYVKIFKAIQAAARAYSQPPGREAG
jgi:aerobic-type carbon monoxide dehydrogenase small subunit (CoxS/CutS family)